MIPVPTAEDFKARFSEFEEADANQLALALSDAVNDEYENVKNENASLAQRLILYLAAHYLAVMQRGKGNFFGLYPTTQINGGGVAKSSQKHAPPSEFDDYFMSTQYGQEYIRIKKIFTPLIMVCSASN